VSYVDAAVEMSNKLHFSLFWMPWEIPIVDLFQVICKEIVECEISGNSLENLMNYLLDGKVPLSGKYAAELKALGYAEGKTHVGVAVKAVSSSALAERKGVQSFIAGVYEKAREAGCNFILHVTRGNRILFMLSAPRGKASAVSKLITEAIEGGGSLALKMAAGIGPSWTDLNKFRESVHIADRLAERADDGCVVNFSELDLERLLYGKSVDVDEIAEIVSFIFRGLERAGARKAGELKHILKVYVKNMCNLADSAQELFMHVNTLRYKLRKIEEYCGCSIKNPDAHFRFHLGFKLEEFLASEPKESSYRELK
jgi:sugar diacid utilization regulator